VKECKADYYLSLDDDSYPCDQNIWNAVEYMEKNKVVGVVGFEIGRLDGSYQVKSRANVPYQTRSFVGCAHLLRVETFRELGGYDESLIHQGEEMHYGALLFKNGYVCMHFPGVRFIHEATQVARAHARVRFHAARNKILWAYDFAPSAWSMLIKMFRGAVEQGYLAIHERSIARPRGLLTGFRECLFSRRPRVRLTGGQFKSLCALEYS
jgi:GT2 family glycosyltransferase